MTESYPVFTPRQDEKFALHGCFEHSTALPRVRRPSHNDFRQILPSQFPKEFSNSSIFFWFWGSRVNRAVSGGPRRGRMSLVSRSPRFEQRPAQTDSVGCRRRTRLAMGRRAGG